MKLTTRGRYGLRVMIELALQGSRGPVMVDTIAANQEISAKYIHVLMTALRNAGLVRATRGPGGGYALARDARTISALEIVEALEGRSSFVKCAVDECDCPRASACAARELWAEVVGAIEGILKNRTLAELAANQRSKQQEPMMFHI